MTTEDESRFTRISVLGSHRNADVVVPTNAPLDLVMTQIAQAVGEDPRQSYSLARLSGGSLRPFATLGQEDVRDGTILQLTRLELTPPSPTVFDLSEATESATRDIGGRWRTGIRKGGLAAVAGAALVLAVLLLMPAARGFENWLLLGGAVALVALASAIAWMGSREAGRALATAGALLGLLPLVLPTPQAGPPYLWLWSIAIVGLAALGVSVRPARWAAGLVTFALVVGAWFLLGAFTEHRHQTAGVIGIAAVLALGLMPQVALASSGVFSAQRRALEMPREQADTLVVRAHDVLAATVAVLGLTMAVAVGAILLDPTSDGWSLGLAGALTVAAALRQRPFPLAAEKLALWTVPLVALGTGVVGPALDGEWVPGMAIAGLVVLAVGLLLTAHVSVPEHVQAQLRMFGDTIETLALVSTIPLAVGMFGTYGRLLGILQGG